jgi:hypothetical protein
MDVDTVDRGHEVGEAVDGGFLLAPVEFLHPIGTKLLHVIEVGAVVPAAIVGHLVPGIAGDARADALKGFVGNIDVEGLDGCHVVMPVRL